MRIRLFHFIMWFILCSSAVFAAMDRESIDCSEVVVLKPYQIPSYTDEKWDGYCSRLFLKKYAPQGFITVFGENRQIAAYQDDYTLIYEFAKKWSADKSALILPIATGGGEGIMRAATLGAGAGRQNAKVLSLGVHIYDPSLNLISEKVGSPDIKRYTFIYRNMSKREADLIDYAQGIVFSFGGIGTVWEFVETLEKIHLYKKALVPIIILSKNAAKYTPIIQLLINKNLISKQMCQYVNLTDSPDKAITLLKATSDDRQHDPSNLCSAL